MITQKNIGAFLFVIVGSLLMGIWLFAANCGPHPAPVPPAPATAIATVAATATAEPTLGPVAPALPEVTATPTPTMPVAGSGGLLHGCHANGPLPDPSCTPGATNPQVTQDNIASTICMSGWTATVRPPVDQTRLIKQERMSAYGVSGPTSAYELDHEVPLELGGAPLDIRNLWPEAADPRPGFHEKDRVENELKREVCAGHLDLATAQKQIATNWLLLYQEMKVSP